MVFKFPAGKKAEDITVICFHPLTDLFLNFFVSGFLTAYYCSTNISL
ncbi:hypothetical protein TREPR_1248 [Treponema primitia ZAS-2]|uniref:Uncharacterized protein n=1 Tax=Treponema primitia (strain ATCC BAA-887 / DSM 12427 / ZAS-2) TaxID=545694 RepID=F5YRI1_TREPZ|nr:hypothetical protein TREPR_1248 [Treponema primitia ZAS-2]